MLGKIDIKSRFRHRMLATIIALMGTVLTSIANDAVYFVNGSLLTPVQETDISIKKEILTISIGDDGIANVEVDYTFVNNGPAKLVTMGFEAMSPYNDGATPSFKGGHPYIMNFSVVMNGESLNYNNGIVFGGEDVEQLPQEAQDAYKKGQYLVPIDFNRWHYDEENSERMYNKQTDEYASFAYAYYFNANFKSGENTVRHTYRYKMSCGVSKAFSFDYWLLPAMRWANHQIDDFTLRINADNCTKHFVIDCAPFEGTPFNVTKGKGKTRTLNVEGFGEHYNVLEVVLRNGTLEWHRNNYRTEHNMSIESAEFLNYAMEWGNKPAPLYYDSGPNFAWWNTFDDYYPGKGTQKQLREFNARLRRNLPYAHRGYVFKDATLKKIFESQWWYMPDPSWQPTGNSFSAHEQELMKEPLE